jgi:hypothetical protein
MKELLLSRIRALFLVTIPFSKEVRELKKSGRGKIPNNIEIYLFRKLGSMSL